MPVTTFAEREYQRQQSLPYYKAMIEEDLSSDLEVNFIGLVDHPAIERNFQAFNAHLKRAWFKINDEKQIISGPAMIADMPIYRSDSQLGEYYVVFDKPAIRAIVEKFSAKGYLRNFNLFHDQQRKVSDVTIFNSFVSDSSLGVPPLAGFEDVADGSWFISAKVNNPQVWQAVKAGKIKGFSVEGFFNYIPAKFSSNKVSMFDIYYDRFEAELKKYPVVQARVEAVMATTKPGQEKMLYSQIAAILNPSMPTAYGLLNQMMQTK